MSKNNFSSFSIFLLSFVALYLLFTLAGFADDINVVFQDINTKTDSIMNWVTDGLIYFIALVAFIAWCVAMLFRKMTYVEGITILIIIILIGFAPTIVKFLIQKN